VREVLTRFNHPPPGTAASRRAVQSLGCILVPSDGLALFMFEGPSAALVDEESAWHRSRSIASWRRCVSNLPTHERDGVLPSAWAAGMASRLSARSCGSRSGKYSGSGAPGFAHPLCHALHPQLRDERLRQPEITVVTNSLPIGSARVAGLVMAAMTSISRVTCAARRRNGTFSVRGAEHSRAHPPVAKLFSPTPKQSQGSTWSPRCGRESSGASSRSECRKYQR
jgi:hypothetical protein